MRDIDVRVAVRSYLADAHARDQHTRIVEEMGIWSGTVRVDVAVINGEFHGFELKSARDTLERLPRQAALYNEVFDRVTLVAAEKHFEKALELVPEWWGLSCALEHNHIVLLRSFRPAKLNPEPNALQIARLLWRPEALRVLEKHNLDRGFRSKPVDVIAQRLADELPLDLLRLEVRTTMKCRLNWLK